MRAFTEGAIALGILLGGAIRLRLYLGSPLPPAEPLLWVTRGLIQDLAVFSFAGAVGLFSTRFFWQRRAWSALTGFILILCVLHLVWSEVVVFFGHPIRARDLQVGLRPVLLLRSVRLLLLLTFAGVVLVSWALIRLTARRARKTRHAWATGSRLSVLALLAFGLSVLPLKVHGAETAHNPLVGLAILIRDWPQTDPGGRFRIPAPALPEMEVRAIASRRPPRDYLGESFPLAHRSPPRSERAPKIRKDLLPNVVFLVMEGVRSEEVGAYGGRIRNLTPRLDDLASRGIRVDRVYSNGTHTPEGELAILYGLLPSPYEMVMTTRSEIPMTGLPELLRGAGWKSLFWIHNGDQNFYRRNDFYLPRGFETIDGRDFPPQETRTNWGYSDRALARRAVLALNQTVEPFAAMVLTVSNHHPFEVPSDAETRVEGLPSEQRGFARFGDPEQIVGKHTVPMLRTIHYTDEAVGYFMELARTRPWFSRTIFVITSDHGLAIAPLEGLRTDHRLIELRHRIPLIFYSPLLTGGKVISGPASLIDVLPTLLGLLGSEADRAGLGRDLFDPDWEDPDRPVIVWTREAETVTVVTEKRVYHGRVKSGASHIGGFLRETLFDPISDPEGKRDLSASDPEAAKRLRRAAQIYLEAYPWLMVEGRSGLPS